MKKRKGGERCRLLHGNVIDRRVSISCASVAPLFLRGSTIFIYLYIYLSRVCITRRISNMLESLARSRYLRAVLKIVDRGRKAAFVFNARRFRVTPRCH